MAFNAGGSHRKVALLYYSALVEHVGQHT